VEAGELELQIKVTLEAVRLGLQQILITKEAVAGVVLARLVQAQQLRERAVLVEMVLHHQLLDLLLPVVVAAVVVDGRLREAEVLVVEVLEQRPTVLLLLEPQTQAVAGVEVEGNRQLAALADLV
jgi:hypothetical protein